MPGCSVTRLPAPTLTLPRTGKVGGTNCGPSWSGRGRLESGSATGTPPVCGTGSKPPPGSDWTPPTTRIVPGGDTVTRAGPVVTAAGPASEFTTTPPPATVSATSPSASRPGLAPGESTHRAQGASGPGGAPAAASALIS